MRVAFVAKSPQAQASVEHLFKTEGIQCHGVPEVVVVIGGDGTFLRAEREYPGVPKALVKDSDVGFLYHAHTAEELAAALKTCSFTIEERPALEAVVHHIKYRAANDVIIRNRLLTHAIRFTIEVGEKPLGREFIGDGLVVATPSGSTAYYHSITRKTFTEGIGIALNNVTQETEVPTIGEEQEIIVTITRGPADLGVDNSMHVEPLKEGDTIRIHKCTTPVRIICVQDK